MQREVRGQTIEIEPNSRPYLLKRIVADGFDVVLIFLGFIVLTLLLMKTPLANAYHRYESRYTAIEQEAVAAYGEDSKAITDALNGNDEYRDARFSASLYGYLIKALACFIIEAVVLLAFPLLNRDRMTPGKRLAGVMMFHERRQSRAMWYQVVGRFLLIFLFDSLAWYLLTGIYTFLLVPVLRLIFMLLNKKHKTLLDYMTAVMIIEKVSYDGIN